MPLLDTSPRWSPTWKHMGPYAGPHRGQVCLSALQRLLCRACVGLFPLVCGNSRAKGQDAPLVSGCEGSRKQVTGGLFLLMPCSVTSSDRSGSSANLGGLFRLRVFLRFVFFQSSLDASCMHYWFRTIALIQRFSNTSCAHMRELKKYCCLGPTLQDSDFISLGWGFLRGKIITFTSLILSPRCTLKSARDL